ILIVAIAGGFWYFAFGPYGQQQAANQRLRDDVAQAQQVIKQAPGQDPAPALTALAHARDRIVGDLANPSLDRSYRHIGHDVRTRQLQPAVKQAIQRYNTAALVTPVGASGTKMYSLTCQKAGGSSEPITAATHLTTMRPPVASHQVLYAINAGRLFQ